MTTTKGYWQLRLNATSNNNTFRNEKTGINLYEFCRSYPQKGSAFSSEQTRSQLQILCFNTNQNTLTVQKDSLAYNYYSKVTLWLW